MSFDIKQWTRFEFEDVPIYVRGDSPAWFVPNRAGDEILRTLPSDGARNSLEVKRFLGRLPDGHFEEYSGRGQTLKTSHLRELWFHITNRCNLACSHCLFASSPEESDELSADRILVLAAEAVELGCKVFALTGGEPFIQPEFTRIIDGLLAYPDLHVVVLTNGLQLHRYREAWLRWGPDRFHLQVSVDGLETQHDRIRGKGAFARLKDQLETLKAENFPFTVSMAVDSRNLNDMPHIVDFAADVGASNVHFMWYFIRGRGKAEDVALPLQIADRLRAAAKRAEDRGVSIDNLLGLRTQVFAPSGTIHDGTSSGWESVAIGPDGKLYPSAAMVGENALATEIHDGLGTAWRESEALERVRQATAKDQPSPMRYITGGGDSDHCYASANRFVGGDPYEPLYEHIALWLIAREARHQRADGSPALRLKMGDLLESCGAHGAIALVHTNCLLAMAQRDSRTAVKDFYADAAATTNEEILNPVCYPDDEISHIPAAFRFRGYGCGSPVKDAAIQSGECVVDLGSGRGVECFVAARMVGSSGRVVGIDMLDPMLEVAREGAVGVAANLGFDNMEFLKGYLEELPLESSSADLILSNCVLNLSSHKRKMFSEIFRVLRPGGRMVVSDVVCEQDPGAAIRNDDVLSGECIAGALRQRDLVGLLEESGFTHFNVLKRFPYRVVRGHPFYSMTFEAWKEPAETAAPLIEAAASAPHELDEQVSAMFRGPAPFLVTGSGCMLVPGQTVKIPAREAARFQDDLFLFDNVGMITNQDLTPTCSCALPPEQARL